MSLRKNCFARTQASQLALLFAMPVGMAALLVDTHASAASLTAVSGWQQGTEPSWVSAYEYVPANFKAGNPILVLVHYCSGNAQGIFQEAQNGGMVTLADQKGILLVVPQTSQNCWMWRPRRPSRTTAAATPEPSSTR